MTIIDKIAIHPTWQSAELGRIPALDKGELHIWCLPLQLNAQQEQYALKWLSELQRDKYNRRASTLLKHAYLAGRYYLLSLLAEYSNTSPQDIRLSYTRLNKPYLDLDDHSNNIHFNFTDTTASGQAMALLAFSRDGAVGVDIEHLSRRGNFKAIAESRFTEKELALVARDNREIDPELFLCLWTRKEASGKATGQGINFKMNQRELIGSNIDQKHLSSISYTDEQLQRWQLTQLRLTEEFIGCVAYAGDRQLTIKAFDRLL